MIKFQKALPGCLLIFLFLAGMAVSASADVNLKVGSDWVWSASGDTVEVDITVDDPETIAGAAFTITYDNTRLNLDSITSDFFDTFANQWAALSPAPDPYPATSVEVDGVTYYQPLIKNEITGGMAIAAARCMPAGAGGVTTIFTLTFSLINGADSGRYAVDIIATVLNNEDAGYDAGGEAIAMVVGADLDKDPTEEGAFPELTPATADPDAGSVSFEIDEDGDGVGDFWEETYFGSTGAKDGTQDSDNDGYSDAQEFENNTDPDEQDAAGGEGYSEITDNRVSKQHVYVEPASPVAPPESDLILDVYYETVDDNQTPTPELQGLELRLFYTSTVIAWDATGFFDEITGAVVSDPISDVNTDYDNDPTTDYYVTVDYSSEYGWTGDTPAKLFEASFTVADVADGTTSNINITADSAEAGYTFYSDPVEFEVQSYIRGDVNNNGEITAQDAVDAFWLSMNASWSPMELATADFNQDGEVTSQDAVDIFWESLN